MQANNNRETLLKLRDSSLSKADFEPHREILTRTQHLLNETKTKVAPAVFVTDTTGATAAPRNGARVKGGLGGGHELWAG